MDGIRYLTALGLLLALAPGCAKSDPPPPAREEKTVRVPMNTWGMEFKSTPIADAPADEREWAKAVAYIQFADGSTATGFFISEDGLFLSNEHIFSRQTCTTERCGGRRIVRDFAPNGDFEVFDRYRVLAQNPELDFALLQVELRPGAKVPFLKLRPIPGSEIGSASDALKGRELVIIGHPFGSSLRSSKAEFQYADFESLRLTSVAMSGNSGSPLIDKRTGWVVGLYNASGWDKDTVEKDTGAVQHYGSAIDIRIIAAVVAERPVTLAALLPRPSDEALTPDKITPDSFAYLALGTPREAQAFKSLQSSISASAVPARPAEDLIHILDGFSRNAALTLHPSENDSRTLLSQVDNEAGNGYGPVFAVYSGMVTQEQCVRGADQGSHTTVVLRALSRNCAATHVAGGAPILDELKRAFDRVAPADRDQPFLNRVRYVIARQTQLGQMTRERLPGALEMLEYVALHATLQTTAFSAEALHAFLQRDPSLVGPGALAGTFPKP